MIGEKEDGGPCCVFALDVVWTEGGCCGGVEGGEGEIFGNAAVEYYWAFYGSGVCIVEFVEMGTGRGWGGGCEESESQGEEGEEVHDEISEMKQYNMQESLCKRVWEGNEAV